MNKHDEERLTNIQGAFKRMFNGEDGETAKKFIEHMAGITDFVPKADLQMVEGLKRFNVLLGKMLNSNKATWVAWYEKNGRNLYV